VFEEITEAICRAAASSLTFFPSVRSQVVCDVTGVRFDPAKGDGVADVVVSPT